MRKIGLTGSIGSGKSAAVAFLRAQGVAVHDADAAVRDIYALPEMTIWLAYHFPQAMASGRLNKAILADTIYDNPFLKQKLESIIHPAVADHRARFLADAEACGNDIVVCDIPLLFEVGLADEFDEVWVLVAADHLRRERALTRENMTPEKFTKIDTAQMPQSEKQTRADVVIENNGTLEELYEKLACLIGKK